MTLNEYEEAKRKGNTFRLELWDKFYYQSCYCCETTCITVIPLLIYNADKAFRTVDRLAIAIEILGLNIVDDDNNAVLGEEYYD